MDLYTRYVSPTHLTLSKNGYHDVSLRG